MEVDELEWTDAIFLTQTISLNVVPAMTAGPITLEDPARIGGRSRIAAADRTGARIPLHRRRSWNSEAAVIVAPLPTGEEHLNAVSPWPNIPLEMINTMMKLVVTPIV
jgi:hypothetical protein